jgi:hypothetical protein
MASVLILLTSSAAAFSPSLSTSFSSKSPSVVRTRPSVAYIDDSNKLTVDDAQRATVWSKTANGLSYKELTRGAGEQVEDEVVTIYYTATVVSTGDVIEERKITFPLQSERFAIFGEAMDGMAVGGTRLVNLPPSSRRYSLMEDEDVSFEINLVRTETGLGATIAKARVNPYVPLLWRSLLVLSFVPDVLNLLGVQPPGAVDNAMEGANAIASAAATAAPAVDAANQWALQGLQATGLL